MKIGFIGVGFMGRHMARHIIEGGHAVTIYDINKSAAQDLLRRGATWAESPAELSANNTLIFTSLPTPKDVEQIALGEGGILSTAKSGSTFFDLSTTDPETIKRISEKFAIKGVEVLDAPVSGGTTGAEKATLCVMVGGEKQVYDKYKDVLDLIGSQVVYCGPQGSGA